MYQKEKRNKIFQVKTISKGIKKMMVLSFIFLFNSFEVCHPLCKENKNIQFSPLNQWNKKDREFLVRSLRFIKSERWKTVVLDLRSVAHLEAFFNQTRHTFSARLLMFQACADVCACNRTFHMPKPVSDRNAD